MHRLDSILQRYFELHSRFGHSPRRGDRSQFREAQRELWALAQAICKITHPKIQAELEAAQRDAIAQIRLHVEHAGPAVVHPRRRQRPILWSDYELTPEFSLDPTTTGACVTKDVAKRLREAHKHQVSAVSSVIHNYRKDFNP
jgi:hypothetical protein